MSASLVGSEMCIRDSPSGTPRMATLTTFAPLHTAHAPCAALARAQPNTCLLYTSDAADDM
eukprot:12992102-Alexandrium_andersonii.AAC.1